MFALDAIALMDALGIENASSADSIGAHARPNILARAVARALQRLVSVSGYLIGSQEANRTPLPPQAELEWWYQYYFATERGRAGYDAVPARVRPADLADRVAALGFDDATFDRSAASFDNPDHVDIVIHNYRWRLGLADGESEYDDLGAKARRATADRRSHHHPGRRRQWCAASGCRGVRPKFAGAVRAPGRSPAASGTTFRRKRPADAFARQVSRVDHIGGTHV